MTLPARHPSARPAVRLGPADLAVLKLFGRYFYLTAQQVTRLLYAPSSHTYSQARLKRLADSGALQRLFLPRPSRTGSAPLVYTLARGGLNGLRDGGQELDRRYRPAEVRELAYTHLIHTLELNDVLIALELLARDEPGMDVAELRHERQLKLEAVPVELPDGAEAGVIPDAWFDLRILGRYQECYCLELDRGTTGQKAWRRKVAALLAYAGGPYQEQFGTESITIAVVATPGSLPPDIRARMSHTDLAAHSDARRDELVRWTEAELAAQEREGLSGLFRFSGAPTATLPPAAFFLSSQWRVPFQAAPVPLLELSGEVSGP